MQKYVCRDKCVESAIAIGKAHTYTLPHMTHNQQQISTHLGIGGNGQHVVTGIAFSLCYAGNDDGWNVRLASVLRANVGTSNALRLAFVSTGLLWILIVWWGSEFGIQIRWRQPVDDQNTERRARFGRTAYGMNDLRICVVLVALDKNIMPQTSLCHESSRLQRLDVSTLSEGI